MTRSTARWSTALAAAALLALPVSSVAQTPGSQQPAPQQTTTQPSPTQEPAATAQAQREQGSPQEHIRKAGAALNEIPAASLTGDTTSRVAELKRHINALERAAAANDKASNWSTQAAAADRILAELLGTPSMSGTGEATGTTGTTGTTGSTKSAPSASMTMDETTRAKLLEVRAHLGAFAAAMGGSSSPSASPSASPAPPSATAESSEAQAQSSPPATAGSSSSQPATTATQAPEPGAAPQAGQADEQAAKRHLTAARNALSGLTQLPAAAQLAGEARTQVSQLITNFNELITTDSEWRASYDKVNANVTALIGAQTADESPAPTSSTAGAVGTTGSAGGGLDPAIRQKLVEFRTHLQQFEKAAGGASSGTPSGDPATSSTANPGSMTNPSSTANPTGSAYPSSRSTSTPGTTPEQSAGAAQRSSQQGSTQPPSEAPGHAEALRHVAAIEAILSGQHGASSPSSPTGTTGSTAGGPATLDRAQIEQIRTHLAELRKLLAEAQR